MKLSGDAKAVLAEGCEIGNGWVAVLTGFGQDPRAAANRTAAIEELQAAGLIDAQSNHAHRVTANGFAEYDTDKSD